MLLGYIRISKSDGSQSLDLQRDALLAAGVAPDRIYDDLASGRHDARPGLEACLKALRPEDTLVVWKLDRLGRNLRHLVTMLEELRGLGIAFVSLGEGIDCTTPAGKLQLHILAALAEFERERIRERVLAGLQRARTQGKRLGRPRAAVPIERLRRVEGLSVDVAAERLGVSRSTVKRWRRQVQQSPSI